WVIGATTPFDAAIARDGSTIAMSGRGTLTAGAGNSATGGGTFRMSGGASGTWSATDVLGFVTYGPAGPKFPAGFTGGEAKLDVRLSNGARGVLTITCVRGQPPDGKAEGIKVHHVNGEEADNDYEV